MTELETLKQQFDFITEVRGKGLLIAMEFDHEIAQDVTMSCLNKGLLINKLKPNAIRFVPPLIITEREIDEAINILRNIFNEKGRKWTR
jgi:acetylornithine/succinyldiaminopimelate/putrescine aminotransferase